MNLLTGLACHPQPLDQQRQTSAVALVTLWKIDVDARAAAESGLCSAQATRVTVPASRRPLTRKRPVAERFESGALVALNFAHEPYAVGFGHRAGRHLRFQALDDGLEALLLDLRTEVRAERLHVRHAFDLHVVGFPTLLGVLRSE